MENFQTSIHIGKATILIVPKNKYFTKYFGLNFCYVAKSGEGRHGSGRAGEGWCKLAAIHQKNFAPQRRMAFCLLYRLCHLSFVPFISWERNSFNSFWSHSTQSMFFVCSWCQFGSIPRHKSQFCRPANLFVCLYIHERICSICLYLSSAPSFCSKLVSCHCLSHTTETVAFSTNKGWFTAARLNHPWWRRTNYFFYSILFLSSQQSNIQVWLLSIAPQNKSSGPTGPTAVTYF